MSGVSMRRQFAIAGAALLGLLSGAAGIGGVPAFAAAPSTSAVLEYYAGTGVAGNVVEGPLSGSPMPSPMGQTFDSQGNTYLATYATNNCYVLKVTPNGTLSKFAGTGVCASASAGPALSATLNKPTNL